MRPVSITFATPEFEPIVPGGAGSVVAGLQARLATRSSVILAAPHIVLTGEAEGRLATVDLREPDGSVQWYVERSVALTEAVSSQVGGGAGPDVVEFTDFEAPAWDALVNRSKHRLEAIRLGVRLHGPVDAITEAVGVRPPPLDVLAEMERLVFRMADFVIVPSRSMANWAAERYSIEATRLVVGPPPMPEVTPRVWRPRANPHFAFFGRLAEAKGAHDLVAAAADVLNDHPDATFSLIGPDGWSLAHDRPMSEVLRSLMPADAEQRIELAGRLPREDALDRLMEAWAVVLPSRFESFCLAAHEARRAGAPVVVPDLPAFESFDEATGALKYDGTVESLANLLNSIAADRGLVEPLASRAAPSVGDPLAVYQQQLPAPRHQAAQNGLATAASVRLSELLDAGKQTSARATLMRHVPERLARTASRLAPERLKVRLRSAWWKEQARRAAEGRSRAVRERVSAGEFARLESPRVSIVIPCFDQGEWVELAVLSVYEQSERSWEILLVDDGSTDPSTVATLEALASWPRVDLIRQDNQGLSAARNTGMTAARGEYLVPLDADDELHPEYLRMMIEAIEQSSDFAYAHCDGRYIGDMDAYWITRPFNPYQLLLSNSVLGCALIRRAAWEKVDGYDESMTDGNEDWDFWIKLLAAGSGQVKVHRPLFRYRIHGHTMSVDALSDLESARASIARRHPDLYSNGAPEELKARSYPWVTVLCSDPAQVQGQTLDDLDVGVVGQDQTSIMRALGETRGKVVVDWDLVSSRNGDELYQLAQALETHPEAAVVTAGGTPVAWRRWVLHDPDAAPRNAFELEMETNSDIAPRLARGVFPIAEWMVPEDLPEPDLEVIRQIPEEEGPLPDWLAR